jgi:hypothetical protein
LDDEIESTKAKIAELKEVKDKLLAGNYTFNKLELKQVNSTLTTDDLINVVNTLSAEVTETGNFINKLEDGSIEKIPEEKMLAAEKEYEKQRNYYKKIRKACSDIISDITESVDMKIPEFIELLGLEMDTDAIKKLKNKI